MMGVLWCLMVFLTACVFLDPLSDCRSTLNCLFHVGNTFLHGDGFIIIFISNIIIRIFLRGANHFVAYALRENRINDFRNENDFH